MEWTEAQLETITTREKNILVSAAAGSGKTAVLVERIKQLMINDGISLDEMLIVTFSNAAASEMREKIVKALTKVIEDGPKEKEEFARIQLTNLHRTNISTFHSFCLEVIKRYFHLINREPNFKICDEAQKSILQAKAMDKLFHDNFEAGKEDFLWFLNEYATVKNENSVRNMIIDTYSFIQSIPDSFNWLDSEVEKLKSFEGSLCEKQLGKEIRLSIYESLKKAEELFNKVGQILESAGIEGIYKKWKLEIIEIKERLNLFIKNFQNDDDFSRALQILSSISYQTYRATKEEKEDYESIKEEVAELRTKGKDIIKKVITFYGNKSVKKYLEEIQETYKCAKCLSILVKEFEVNYKKEKDDKSLIDFNDIEHLALQILAHEAAAKEYREKFKYIFIDEYQDSNLVQETLINYIKRENNLFMVGDVKQSIYKFRLAEPEIFINKYELYKKEDNSINKIVDLNQNFRSKKSVINGVNQIFSEIMTKSITGLEYDDRAALYQGLVYETKYDKDVEMYISDDGADEEILDDEIAHMKNMELEAFHSAQIIKDALGKEFFDPKSNSVKTLCKKDIVILLRGVKNTAEYFSDALAKEGITSFVDSGEGYFDTVEIEVFINLLRVIENYKQDIPLISVLKSPVFDFTLEELAQIRIENRKLAYEKAFCEYINDGSNEGLRNKCSNSLKKIKHWSKESSFIPLEDFLWKLMKDTGYYVYVSSLPEGIQRQANLRAIIDKAVQFQNNQGKGLFQFINYIEAVKKEKVSMGQVKLLGEKDDVVRIMTIHKSKGLEFPMVLVCGLGKKFNRGDQSNNILLHKDLGIGLRLMDRKNNSYVKTLLQTAISEKKSKEELAEDIRVLYVAFTRAMDKLVLIGTPSSGNSYLKLLMPILDKTNIRIVHKNRREVFAADERDNDRVLNIEKLLNLNCNRQDLIQTVSNKLDFKYSQDSIVKTKYSVSEINKLESGSTEKEIIMPKLNIPVFKEDKKLLTGAEKGTLIHKFMEHLDFNKMRDKDNLNTDFLKNILSNFVNKEMFSDFEAENIDLKKVVKFFQSEIGQRACMAEKIFKETNFNLKKIFNGNSIIVQGTVDCYFQEKEEYILIDYKSNYVRQNDDSAIDDIIRNYKVQLDIYKEALERIKHMSVKESYLYLFSIDKEIKVL